ncbi:hypothetical protein [Pseudaquabacterium rugosum]|uniref:Uncharacterized protein n=1 Tax=Pseudaquabacterium rugosum TaxID=2984194 RepID=A0ABU9BB27_9BURK
MFLLLSLPAILRGPARHRLPAGVLALGALLSPAAQALDLFDPALGSPAAQG